MTSRPDRWIGPKVGHYFGGLRLASIWLLRPKTLVVVAGALNLELSVGRDGMRAGPTGAWSMRQTGEILHCNLPVFGGFAFGFVCLSVQRESRPASRTRTHCATIRIIPHCSRIQRARSCYRFYSHPRILFLENWPFH